MYFYNYDYDLEYRLLHKVDEQQLFFSLLYHDARKGKIIRMKLNEFGKAEQKSISKISNLVCTGTDANIYVSMNTFRGRQRTADQMFNRTAFFVDLDYHAYHTEEELQTVLDNTKEILEKAYQEKELAVPTCIVNTGRGFAIYYILKSSIANVNASKASLSCFERVYAKLCDRYKEVLKNASTGLVCDVDYSVRDASRIVRVPGTMNLNNGKLCHLVSVNYGENSEPLYYNISEIISGCKLIMGAGRKKEQTDKEDKKDNVISMRGYLKPFLKARVSRMERLRDLRGMECVDKCREVMCFITYSALTQIYPYGKAWEKLVAFNEGFVVPLPESELSHIVGETDNHVVPDGRYKGCKGFYPYRDYTIIQTLDMTSEEIKEVGFGSSWKRQRIKEENQKKKQERNEKIIALIGVPENTYAMIAKEVGVSAKTVERVAKAAGVNRYHINKDEDVMPARRPEAEACVAPMAEVIDFEEKRREKKESGQNKRDCKNMQTDKKCYESWCVPTHINLDIIVSSLGDIGEPALARRLVGLLAEAERLDVNLHHELMMHMEFCYPFYEGLSYKRFLEEVRYDVEECLYQQVRVFKLNRDIHTKTKKERAKQGGDPRFFIVKYMIEKEHRQIPMELYELVKKAFYDLKRIKQKEFLISGKTITVKDLRDCFDSMKYREIVVICERILSKMDYKKIKKPLFYVAKCVWTYQHPEDSFSEEQKRAYEQKHKIVNRFHNFHQRTYDYEELDARILNRDIYPDTRPEPELGKEITETGYDAMTVQERNQAEFKERVHYDELVEQMPSYKEPLDVILNHMSCCTQQEADFYNGVGSEMALKICMDYLRYDMDKSNRSAREFLIRQIILHLRGTIAKVRSLEQIAEDTRAMIESIERDLQHNVLEAHRIVSDVM